MLGRTFTFGEYGGKLYTHALRLGVGGRIEGYEHPETRRWRIERAPVARIDEGGGYGCSIADVLVLADESGQTTVSFTDLHVGTGVWSGVARDGRTLAVRDCTDAWLGLPGKDGFEIVVARYREPIEWASLLRSNVTVYEKGTCDWEGGIPLPNVGREANTYLEHIVARYDTLAERTLFVQGSPFEHHLLPWPLYAQGAFTAYQNSVKRFDDGWLSARDKRAFADRYVRIDVPAHYRHTDGAQFSVHRRLIRARGLAYWEDLLALSRQETLALPDTTLDDYCVGLLFEAFWPSILNPDGLPTYLPRAYEAPIRSPALGIEDAMRTLRAEHSAGVHRGFPVRFDW